MPSSSKLGVSNIELLKIAAINPAIKTITNIITTATQPPATIAEINALIPAIIALTALIVA